MKRTRTLLIALVACLLALLVVLLLPSKGATDQSSENPADRAVPEAKVESLVQRKVEVYVDDSPDAAYEYDISEDDTLRGSQSQKVQSYAQWKEEVQDRTAKPSERRAQGAESRAMDASASEPRPKNNIASEQIDTSAVEELPSESPKVGLISRLTPGITIKESRARENSASTEISPISLRCCFSQDGRLSSGDRVTLRTLEQVRIAGLVLPQHSDLLAMVSLSDRLYLSVSAVQIGDRTIPVHLVAYDADGLPGLHCSAVNTGTQTIARRSLGVATRELRSGVGRLAGDLISLGSSALSSSNKQFITVSTSYKFTLQESL